MNWFLFRVLGKRVFILYGAVSLLSVAILASLYMTSGYALENYIVDQLQRMPWDISVVQRGEAHRFEEMRADLTKLEGIQRIENLGFLRVRNSNPLRLEIDQSEFPVRWVAFVAASKENLLPPELHRTYPGSGENSTPPPYQLALVAAQRGGRGTEAMEASKLVRTGSNIRIAAIGEVLDHDDVHEHSPGDHAVPIGGGETIFSASVTMPPVQFERQEFNKWMLRDIGSLSYLPEEAIVISIPMDEFKRMAEQLGDMFLSNEGIHGGEAPPPYVPEVTHLLTLDRSRWVSPWELDESLSKVQPFVKTVHETAQWLTPFAYVNSDLLNVLERMSGIARLVQLVTVLVALPLLWLGWVLAKSLSGLLVWNERRLIGLALVRGIPMNAVAGTLLLALMLGGFAGSLAGLAIGTGIPVLGYSLAGHSTPSQMFFLRGLVFFAGFVFLGVVFSLASGYSILRYVRKMTPNEAMARVLGTGSEEKATRASKAYIFASFLALLLGGYKVASWLLGYSILARWAVASQEKFVPVMFVIEGALNFIGVPLFLFGITGLLAWRVKWIRRGLSAITAPLVGNMHWFVGQHMALRSGRVVTVLFVSALAMALTLLPQIAADSFYGRVVRGVQASVGGDLHLEFNMTELTDGEAKVATLDDYEKKIAAPIASIRAALQNNARVSSVTTIQQYVIPGVYIPGQSGLMINIVDLPNDYLQSVYHEETLGLTRPFRTIIGGLTESSVAASQGLMRLREIPLDHEIILGYGGDAPVPVRFHDVLSFLPGQPTTGVAEREGFVTAEVDYLNYMLRSDARMIVGGDYARTGMAKLNVLPSRSVFVVRTKSGEVDDQFVEELSKSLPLRPQGARWESA